MPRKRKKLNCMIRGCTKPEKHRGLCRACYESARRLIRSGKTTDLELVDRKMLRRKKPNAGRPRARFASMFTKQVADELRTPLGSQGDQSRSH